MLRPLPPPAAASARWPFAAPLAPQVPARGAAHSSRLLATPPLPRAVSRSAAAPNDAAQPAPPALLSRPQKKVAAQVRDVPAGSPRTVLNKYLAPGKLLEFRSADAALAGVVRAVIEPRAPTDEVLYKVAAEDGTTHEIRPSQVVVVMPGVDYPPEAAAEFADAAAATDRGRLHDLWQAMLREAESSAPAEELPAADVLHLCDRLCGDKSARSLFITHRLLCQDRVYFSRLKTRPPTYYARSPEEVATATALLEQEAQQEAYRGTFAAALRAAAAAEPLQTQAEWLQGPHAEAVTHLANFAKRVDGAPHGTALLALVDLGFDVSADGAGALLKTIGFWPRHLPFAVLRESPATAQFPQYIEDAAAAVLAAPPTDDFAATRRDFTAQTVLAIDDEATREVDDAIAVETLPVGGWRMWVHVADPAAYVQQGSPIDLEAMQRGRTLYLPWTKVTMMPKALAEGPLSLSGAGPRSTLTFVADVAADGALTHFDVVPGRVAPAAVSYDAADRVIRGAGGDHPQAVQDALRAMHACAGAREAYRMRNGGADMPSVDCEVVVDDVYAREPQISVSNISMADSPARVLVMEAMVLAGEVAAKFAAARRTPVVFRHQGAPSPPPADALAKLSSPFARGFLLRRGMVRSEMSTDFPKKHHALGLDAYAQVTSPIRRYTDLLVHYQLRASLLGRTPPHTCSSLEAACKRVGDLTREHKRLERDCRSHFLAMYFDRFPHNVYSAEVLGASPRDAARVVMLVRDLGLESDMPLPAGQKLFPGNQVTVRPAHVNTLTGTFSWVLA